MTSEAERAARVYPCVIKCRGGWFAVDRAGDIGSGPWRTEQAALAALNHEYEKAHRIEGTQPWH